MRISVSFPPLVYLTSLVSGVVIHLATPLRFLPEMLAIPIGVPLIAVAIALFSYSVAKFRAARTSVPALKPTTVIVRTGPYRFSRNPIYLAYSLFQLGIVIWGNSAWLLATLVGAVALIHRRRDLAGPRLLSTDLVTSSLPTSTHLSRR